MSDRFIQLVIRLNFELTNADFYDHADLDNHFILIYGCPLLGWMRNNQTTANFVKFTDYIEYQVNHGYYVEPTIAPKFKVVNTGSSQINLANLTLRYYYTVDSEKQQNFWCDNSGMMSGSNYIDVTKNVTGKFVKMSTTAQGTDYYLEVGFSK